MADVVLRLVEEEKVKRDEALRQASSFRQGVLTVHKGSEVLPAEIAARPWEQVAMQSEKVVIALEALVFGRDPRH